MTGESEDQIVCLLDQMQIALEPQPVFREHTVNRTVPTNLEIPDPERAGGLRVCALGCGPGADSRGDGVCG